MGSHTCRVGTGVRAQSYHVQNMPSYDWDNIVSQMKKGGKSYLAFALNFEIRRIQWAKELLHFSNMTTSYSQRDSSIDCQQFSALTCSTNAHHNTHIDDGFGYSVLFVHLDDHYYRYEDKIIAYFFFLVWVWPLHYDLVTN